MDSSHHQSPSDPITTPDQVAHHSGATHGGPGQDGNAKGKTNWIGRILFVLVLVVVAGGVAAYVFDLIPGKASHASTESKDTPLGVQLVAENTLLVPEDVRKALGIRKGNEDRIYTVEEAKEMRKIVMPGSTALNPSTLYRVKVRFAPCEAFEIAKVPDVSPDEREKLSSEEAKKLPQRELRSGDPVKKGDRLATVYSVDVGQKKNDLIDSLSQLKLDETILDSAQKAEGSLPAVFILNAVRNVEADHNNVARALNTLQAWNIPKADIDACFKEADEIIKRRGHREVNRGDLGKWARVDLYAPEDGIIVQRDVSEHEIVNDNTVSLFQIAKVDRLSVFANVPEDEVPALMKLSTEERRWEVKTVGSEPVNGVIDDIGILIDPSQHTAVVKGHIDNPRKILRAGQFISATVKLKPPTGVVEVPVDAVVEDGQTSVVFVQDPKDKQRFTMRRVQPTQRFDTKIFIRSTEFSKEEQRTAEEEELGIQPKEPLRAGERIITSGVGELKAALLDLQSQPKKEAK